MEDRTQLNFCNICGVDDLSIEDFQIMLGKLRNRRTINLLQIMPKHEVLNTKNLNVITRFGIE